MDFNELNKGLEQVSNELKAAQEEGMEVEKLQEVALTSINKASKLVNDLHQAVLKGDISVPEWTYCLNVLCVLFEQVGYFSSKPVFEAVISQFKEAEEKADVKEEVNES
jgi:hypothetical protein